MYEDKSPHVHVDTLGIRLHVRQRQICMEFNITLFQTRVECSSELPQLVGIEAQSTTVKPPIVGPPIVGPPREGHCIKNLSTEDSSRDPKNFIVSL